MGFNCSALNPRNPKNPFSTAVLRRCLHHHIRKNHRHITPRHPRPPAGACANHIPSSHRICRPLRAIAPLGAAHCAHAQGQSRVRACRTVREEHAAPAAWEMQTETPPKQAALARQVRQRMNRLGKPEHRARFCFFSKKKSLAGMRRFPIPSKIKFGWALTAALSILATPKTLFQPPSFAGACTTTSAKTTAT